MGRIVFKRLLRYAKQNAAKYIGLLLLTSIVSMLVSSLVIISDTIIVGRNDSDGLENIDDGQFELIMPITDDKIAELEQTYGAVIQKMYSFDVETDRGITLRIFKNRTLIDKLSLHEGDMPLGNNSIVVDQLFASGKGGAIGYQLTASGTTFTVCGNGCVPDYERLIKSTIGFSSNFDSFTWAIVSDGDYDTLKQTLHANEVYTYAFTLSNADSVRDFRRAIVSLDFNYKDYVTDNLYFEAYLKDCISQIADIDALKDAISQMTDGSAKLHSALETLTANNSELSDASESIGEALQTLKDASGKLTEANAELKNGAASIADAVSEAVDLLDEPRGYIEDILNGVGKINDLVNSVELPEEYNDFVNFVNKANDKSTELLATWQTIYSGAKELSAAVQEFNEGIISYTDAQQKITEALTELSDGYAEFDSSLGEYLSATEAIRDGSADLDDALKQFEQYVEDEIDRQINKGTTNAASFTLSDDNARMNAVFTFAKLYYSSSLAVGAIMIALLALIFSIMTTHQINAEAPTIGALYALGVGKGTMMIFYLIPPMICTALGGLSGVLISYSPWMLELTSSSFRHALTFPYYQTTFPVLVLVLIVFIPIVINLAVNLAVLKKTFSRTALSLLQGNIDNSRVHNIKLHTKNFLYKFQIRQILREGRIAFVIVISILLALMLVMIGVNSELLIYNAQDLSNKNTLYEYSYILRYPMSDLDCGGERIYQQALRAEAHGTYTSVVLIGLQQDSRYYNAHPEQNQNTAVISSAAATKFDLGIGDYILLNDKMTERNYAFCVCDIAETGASLEVYIDIDCMRDIFGKTPGYYNTIVSDVPLNIDPQLVETTMTKADMLHAFDFQLDAMNVFIRLTLVCASIVYAVVLYLVVSMMIERNKRGISLARILGYRMGEIRKMYIYCIMYIVTVSLLIGIPLSKYLMDKISPLIYLNLAIGQFYQLDFIYYVLIFASSFLFLMCLVHAVIIKLKKIGFTYALRAKL